MPNIWSIVALVIALVSLILAIIGRDVASPAYLLWLAIFVVLFFGAKSPW